MSTTKTLSRKQIDLATTVLEDLDLTDATDELFEVLSENAWRLDEVQGQTDRKATMVQRRHFARYPEDHEDEEKAGEPIPGDEPGTVKIEDPEACQEELDELFAEEVEVDLLTCPRSEARRSGLSAKEAGYLRFMFE